MQSQISGLFTCDECGASVAEDSTTRHLEWHKAVNDAFEGAARLIKALFSEIEQLSSPE